MLSKEMICDLFYYNNGSLYWKNKPNFNLMANYKAGSKNKIGYVFVRINGKSYLEHRMIFMMFNDFLPKQIDHINGIRTDNRIENLRAASHSENKMNSKMYKNNSSGAKNVYKRRDKEAWFVKIRANNKVIYCGSFDDFELAELVAVEAREKYHGNFAKHE